MNTEIVLARANSQRVAIEAKLADAQQAILAFYRLPGVKLLLDDIMPERWQPWSLDISAIRKALAQAANS